MNPHPDALDHPGRVLIVDDERGNRELLKVMLAPEGLDLRAAASGEEALAMVAEQPPELILLDVIMPGLDGYEVTDRIKRNAATKNIPVILITAHDDRKARMLGLSAGAEDVLSRPLDRGELCIRIRNLLRLKRYSDVHDKYAQTLEDEVASRTSDLRHERDRARKYEERMRFALETTDVGIWEMDYGTGVLQWSATLEAQYGLLPGTFGGTFDAFVERVHPDDQALIRETLDRALTSGQDFAVQSRALWPDGTVRWLAGSGRIQLGKLGEPVRGIGISQDITERRAQDRQYQQAHKMEAIGRLASGVAHDFNNMLTVILGCAELVAADGDTGNRHRDDLNEIIKAARRAAGLTKQLLAFGRQQVMHAAPLDVNGLIINMSGMLDRLIGEHIEVSLTLAPNLSQALADRSQVEQVLMNLVVNARDAMPNGGRITIHTDDIELESSSFHEVDIIPGNYVMLAITDTGGGMTTETQRLLFEPFFTTKEPGKGTGLGLSTTYGIVKQSNGYIWVYSELGRGTTFKVYLPRSSADVAPEEPGVVAAPTRTMSAVILLVEDLAAVRHLAKRILENAGYQVLEAANGDEAEALFAGHAGPVDLLVTDVVMPGCGGPELFARLRVDVPSLKVLYMSGYTEQSTGRNMGIDGGFAFVQKPFTGAELIRKVREALARRSNPSTVLSPAVT